jgi:hypothetical protein
MTTTARGGRRPGAGRPKGRTDLATRQATERAATIGGHDDPMQFLLALMRDPKQDVRMRIAAAKALLPYCHMPKGRHPEEADAGTEWEGLLQ